MLEVIQTYYNISHPHTENFPTDKTMIKNYEMWPHNVCDNVINNRGLRILLDSVWICSGLRSEICLRPAGCLPVRRLPAPLPLHCRDPVPMSTGTRSALQLRPLITETKYVYTFIIVHSNFCSPSYFSHAQRGLWWNSVSTEFKDVCDHLDWFAQYNTNIILNEKWA